MGIGVFVTCLLVPMAVQFGLIAVTGAMLVKGAITWIVGAQFVQRISGYPARNQISVGWGSLLASCVMVVAVAVTTPVIGASLAGLPLIAALVTIGVAVHLVALAVLDRELVRAVGRVFLARIGRGRRSDTAASTSLHGAQFKASVQRTEG